MNVVAMAGGVLAVFFVGKVRLPGLVDFGNWMPAWWPVIAWPWYVLIGCCATLLLAVPFRTGGSPSLDENPGQGFSGRSGK
jgi:hypothetical protein